MCDKDSISLCQGWFKENDFQVSSKRIPKLNEQYKFENEFMKRKERILRSKTITINKIERKFQNLLMITASSDYRNW